MAGRNIGEVREELIKEAREKVKERYKEKDIHVIKAVSLMDSLDEIFNNISEHLIEWYSIHFPELKEYVSDNEVYLNFILLGERTNYSQKKIKDFFSNETTVKNILNSSNNSVGAEIDKGSINILKGMAENALQIRKQRNELNNYIEKTMRKIAVNFSKVCGGVLASRLLAQAGSLERLAMMPSSTIQVLGAEKALFQHLRKGSRPPKHGFIFQHPYVRGLKAGKRGKMARILSGKLSIALKEDYFGDKDISKELIDELEEKFNSLKELK